MKRKLLRAPASVARLRGLGCLAWVLALLSLGEAFPEGERRVILSAEGEGGQWVLPKVGIDEDDEAPAEPITPQEGRFELPLHFPGWADIEYRRDLDLREAVRLIASVELSPEAPKDVQVLFYVKDEDHQWYQLVDPTPLDPGVPVSRSVAFDEETPWYPTGHGKAWDLQNLRRTRVIGLRLQSSRRYEGTAKLGQIELLVKDPGMAGELRIEDFQASSPTVAQYDRFELTFRLSRRFDNPFDPSEVMVMADFTSPSGKVMSIPGFWNQSFGRDFHCGAERLTAIGECVWKVRFCPTEVGCYRYALRVVAGETVRTKPRTFDAVPSSARGFVRRPV